MTIHVESHIVPSELHHVPQEWLSVWTLLRCNGGFEFIHVHVAWEMFYLYGDIEMGVKQEYVQCAGSVICEAS